MSSANVRRKLAEGMVADLQNRLREQSAEGLLALAEPEIVRAIKLLVPGLHRRLFHGKSDSHQCRRSLSVGR